MNGRSRNERQSERLARAAFPGFAVPTRFLTFAALGWMGLFLVLVAWFTVGAWIDGAAVWELLMPAPFVVAAVCAVRMTARAHARSDLAGVVRGVRLGRWTVLAAGVLAVGGMAVNGLWIGDFDMMLFGLLMGTFVAAAYVAPQLGPLVCFERRLKARLSLGNPAWHPRQASITQRGEAVLAYCAAVGAFSCAVIGLRHGLAEMPSFNGENFLTAGAITMLGFVAGIGVGAAPGALIAHALNDRDLSRALPLLLWTPLAALGGSLLGVGWGLGAVVITMLVIGKVGAIRCKIPEPHRCTGCGYDLTGTATDQCPECGDGAPIVPTA